MKFSDCDIRLTLQLFLVVILAPKKDHNHVDIHCVWGKSSVKRVPKIPLYFILKIMTTEPEDNGTNTAAISNLISDPPLHCRHHVPVPADAVSLES